MTNPRDTLAGLLGDAIDMSREYEERYGYERDVARTAAIAECMPQEPGQGGWELVTVQPHTPGPYSMRPDPYGMHIGIYGPLSAPYEGDVLLASVQVYRDAEGECEANARMFCAAPQADTVYGGWCFRCILSQPVPVLPPDRQAGEAVDWAMVAVLTGCCLIWLGGIAGVIEVVRRWVG